MDILRAGVNKGCCIRDNKIGSLVLQSFCVWTVDMTAQLCYLPECYYYYYFIKFLVTAFRKRAGVSLSFALSPSPCAIFHLFLGDFGTSFHIDWIWILVPQEPRCP